MGNKEAVRKTRVKEIGKMTRNWIYNRFGVDETPVVDQKPVPKKIPEVVLFDVKVMEADWIFNRFGVDER